jgi:hypothetical protein
MTTYTTIREQIHQRLDPVIEEIVSREISEHPERYQRGAYGAQQPTRCATSFFN